MTARSDPADKPRKQPGHDQRDAERPQADKPVTPERREDDPAKPDGCDPTPGGRRDASAKPECPEGYPEEQQTDDPAKRPGQPSPPRPGQTKSDSKPDQRER